jgi:hypothetical protein
VGGNGFQNVLLNCVRKFKKTKTFTCFCELIVTNVENIFSLIFSEALNGDFPSKTPSDPKTREIQNGQDPAVLWIRDISEMY